MSNNRNGNLHSIPYIPQSDAYNQTIYIRIRKQSKQQITTLMPDIIYLVADNV